MDSEDESLAFHTDDESIDFQSEADNMSFMSRHSVRSAAQRPSAGHVPAGGAAPPTHQSPVTSQPPAAATQQQQPHPPQQASQQPSAATAATGPGALSSSSDSDDSPAGAQQQVASPRGMTATNTGRLTSQTLAAHTSAAGGGEKKTVVSQRLARTRGASGRGRSPAMGVQAVTASPNSAPQPSPELPPPTVESDGGDAPAGAESSGEGPAMMGSTARPSDEQPPAAEGGPRRGSADHFDAAGVTTMMKILNNNAARSGVTDSNPAPSSFRVQEVESEGPSCAASPQQDELQKDLIAMQQQQLRDHQRRVALGDSGSDGADDHGNYHGAPRSGLPLAPLEPSSFHASQPQPATTAPAARDASSDAARRDDAAAAARDEAMRTSLSWYRSINADLERDLDSLDRRILAERASAATAQVRREVAARPSSQSARGARNDTSLSPISAPTSSRAVTVSRGGSRPTAPVSSASPARANTAPTRGSSSAAGQRKPAPSRPTRDAAPTGTTKAKSKASEPRPQQLEASAEGVVRNVAQRYGVIVPAPQLTGDSRNPVVLPDRLFFATGVQLTKDQRTELADRMRAALKQHTESQPGMDGMWLPAAEDTDLGSRSGSLLRVVQDHKTRVASDASPARGSGGGLNELADAGPATAPASGTGSRAGPDWIPFTGPMRQRTRQSRSQSRDVPIVPKHVLSLMPKTRKRTEVLRDTFNALVTHRRGVLLRSELEVIQYELTKYDDLSDAERLTVFGDLGLAFPAALMRHDRRVTLDFVSSCVIPLLLLSGFEEFDFPLFSQVILRVAEREALPSDFAFQPTAVSPLAKRGRRGGPEEMSDLATAAERVSYYLNELCACTAVGGTYTVKAATR